MHTDTITIATLLEIMDLVAGPMGNLPGKLLQLLQDEYKLQKGVKAQVKCLADELKSTNVALCKVAQVPYDQLDPQVKLWASEAREASYDMEDILDTFFVRVDGCHQPTDGDKGNAHRLKEMMDKMFDKISLKKTKARREISIAIDDIKKQVDEIAKRRDRCKVDNVVSNYATTKRIDPRKTLHVKDSDLVGIDKSMDTLIKMLTDDVASGKKMKLVSIVGFGGLGKTTLTKLVYKKLTRDMNIDCKAFVSVGQKPNLMKVLRDILLGLDRRGYMNEANFNMLDEEQLKEEIQDFLKEKRFFIVVDDVWEVPTWKYIETAFEDNNMGSKIMITTRHSDVADLVPCTYKVQPLGPESSKQLFYGRIFGSHALQEPRSHTTTEAVVYKPYAVIYKLYTTAKDYIRRFFSVVYDPVSCSEDTCPPYLCELSDSILKKCDGVPLAIITIASLLANKQGDIIEWQEVCKSIGSGLSSSNDMYNDMRKILSLSYDDLPSHLKTCFLYLSIYPEDHVIDRYKLIWKWISEGFIQPPKIGDDLFELGESYFNDLINRNLIQKAECYCNEITACRVHDMILDLISSLSREENFSATSDDIQQVMYLESKKIRRLSLRNSTWPKTDVSHVRSIVAFAPSIDLMPSFLCLDMLRVLDLEGYSFRDCEGFELCVGDLIHLRYLGLYNTGLTVLPTGIEKLQFLQVLMMNEYVKVLDSIFGLRRLMCLCNVDCSPQRGYQLRNMSSLQMLVKLCLDEDPAGIVEALGYLTRLTVLVISIKSEVVDQSLFDALMNSLSNMPRLKVLSITESTDGISLSDHLISWEHWASSPPHHLNMLGVDTWLKTLPKWIRPESLPHLIALRMNVHIVHYEDIITLGKLPNLVFLHLKADSQYYLQQPLQKFVASADAFPRLEDCNIQDVVLVPSMFTRGAMPLVTRICFNLRMMDFFTHGGFNYDDLAMDHIPSLRYVYCTIIGQAGEEEEMKKLKEAVKHAVDVHPNHHPGLIYYDCKEKIVGKVN